jgi:hypothetical protein
MRGSDIGRTLWPVIFAKMSGKGERIEDGFRQLGESWGAEKRSQVI